MDKKCLVTGVVMALIAAMCTPVSADMFSHVINWSGGTSLTEGSDFSYMHDLRLATPKVEIAAGDNVESANLMLKFVDDGGPGEQGGPNESIFEYALVSLNGTWNDLGEINNGSYSLSVAAALLNVDGVLNVVIRLYDYDTENIADVRLMESALSGEFTPVPVPAAFLLGMLGLGMAGVKLRRHA